VITVHGLLGAPDDRLRAAASSADWVVAGTRQLDSLGVPPERRIVLGALSTAVAQVLALPAEADVLVVASGDPGFFGVLRALRRHGLRPQVVPAVSSIASAFAAVGLPWDDAAVVSVHGRRLEPALRLARDCAKVAVFTSAEHGIRELAAGLGELERHWVLAERLGEPDQRVRVLTSAEALTVEPVEPNVVLILDRPPTASDPAWAGIVAEPSAAGVATEATDSTASRSASAEPVIGQVTSGLASQVRADRVDAILGVTTRRYTSGAVAGLPQAWAECDLVISHLALGATTRLIAPLLQSKLTDPGVVVLDEAGRFAVPLVGGHTGGANELARRLADGLDATAVLTTATDAVGVPGLDTLGWPWSGAVAEVTRAILDERPVRVVRSQPWPLPALPSNVTVETGDSSDGLPDDPGLAGLILVTDRLTEPSALSTVVLNPPSLVAGLGCNAGTKSSALRALLTESLTEAGLALASLAALTTVDAKADEPGLVALAAELGVPLVTYPAPTLAAQDVPNPSEAPLRAVGTPSVAEASVLAHGASLIVEKQRTPQATCAIGRLPARGKLTVVGLGPGSRDLTTPRAQAAIREASVVVGYRPYVAQIKDLLAPGVRIASTPMGKEAERTATAIELARQGNKVALVCSGDPAIYAMASPTLEQGTDGIDVEIVPGVTASLAASAILGAPLGHDHATISLSDLHTDWDTILRRLRAAAEADLVTVLYNPRSRTRLHHLPDAVAIFAAHRPGTTPIAVVEEADRPDQRVTLSTIAEFDPSVVNMNSLVVIGSSTTRYLPAGVGGTAMVTPRDYHWMNR
jgi:cobalt-precorrin 5A hydrolase/precorrin-3B C17-methyltransferase